MRILRGLIIVCGCVLSGQAAATIITYNYTFATPVFDNPPFGLLNTSLSSAAGASIEGEVTFDTDKVNFSGGGVDEYITSNGGFSQTGELDAISWFTTPTYLYTTSGSNALEYFFLWEIYDGDNLLTMVIDFGGQSVDVECYSFDEPYSCDGEDFYGDSRAMTDLEITTPPPTGVPAPATLALFGIGLAGLGWSRHKRA